MDTNKEMNLIDTIGFDDSNNDVDLKIIADLVNKLKNNVDYINTFMITINGQTSRIDGSLVAMINYFEDMFGKEFWKQTIIVFTRLQMDERSVRRRRGINKKNDEDMAEEYIKDLQK